ncbi:hypothetical protein LBMAG56_44220 [Verrucomicrobiota bacterium]|nr:hypothetical protein LBMAG56_44220 [Verrucomicrobiota bacterium]
MKTKAWKVGAMLAGVGVMLCAAGILRGQETRGAKGTEDRQPPAAAATSKGGDESTAAVAAARERAKLLHDIYSTTLEVMHRHYFRAERAVLPARAMEDVFADMARLSNDSARWIAVNTQAMSVQHAPKTDFDRKAAAELATGKEAYERVEDGVYQRAGSIPLGSSCVGCHTKHFSGPIKSPRFAGLVIAIPLSNGKK